MQTRYLRNLLVTVVGVFAGSLVLHGCNMVGSLDNPKSKEEIEAAAQIKLDTGTVASCAEAATDLDKVGSPDDTTYRLKGWTKLCSVGGTLGKIGSALFAYSSSTDNLTIIGNLANAIAAQDGTTITTINSAVSDFNRIVASNDKSVFAGIGYLIKAGALIRKSAGATAASVVRTNVAAQNCYDLSDSAAAAASANCDTGMSDGDVDDFISAVASAGSSLGSSFGNATELTNRLEQLTGTAGAAAGRRTTRWNIVRSMLSQ